MTTHLAEKMGIAKGNFEEPAWMERSREAGVRVWTSVTAPKRLPRHPFQEIAEHAMCGTGANLDVVPSREAVRPYLGVVGPSYKDVMDRLFDAAEELRQVGMDWKRREREEADLAKKLR